jgi:hypothetical protein
MMCIDPNGFDAGTVPEAGTGNPDPSCPTISLGGFITLDGCCMSDNTCGYVSAIGGGCVTVDMLRNIPGIMLPDALMSCVYVPPPTR